MITILHRIVAYGLKLTVRYHGRELTSRERAFVAGYLPYGGREQPLNGRWSTDLIHEGLRESLHEIKWQ